jgi:hypothetical protein
MKLHRPREREGEKRMTDCERKKLLKHNKGE